MEDRAEPVLGWLPPSWGPGAAVWRVRPSPSPTRSGARSGGRPREAAACAECLMQNTQLEMTLPDPHT